MDLLLSFLLLLAGAADAFAQAQPRVFFHGVSIYDHTGVEFVVNGFHFRPVTGDKQPLITTDLTPYLLVGTNELKWRFSGQPVADIPAFFRFRLERETEGVEAVAEAFTLERFFELQQEDTASNLVTFFVEKLSIKPVSGFRHELRSRLDSGQATKAVIDLKLPQTTLQPAAAQPSEAILKVTFTNAVLATLPWQGTPIALTDSDRQEIRNIVAAMQAAFLSRDTNALATLQIVRIQRLAAARRQTEVEFRAELLASYSLLYGNPPFAFAPLDPADLAFIAYSDANLVQIEKAGEPPIKATGQADGRNATFKVPIYLSKIAGVWKIVD